MNDVAQAPVETGTIEPSPPPRTSRRKLVRLAIGAAILAAFVGGGIAYWLHAAHYESTDDAYVNANTIDVAAQVAGQVVKVVAMLPLVLPLRRRKSALPPPAAVE